MGKTELDSSNWLKSKEVEKALKISSCDLANLRIAGKLKYTKKGNAFFYDKKSILKIKKKNINIEIQKEIEKTEIEFLDEKSAKGTDLKYIKFNDTKFRFSDIQKKTLKEICKGYFFYSKSKKMWGFTDRGYNEVNVYNFITEESVTEDINTGKVETRNIEIKKETIPFKIEDFEIKFIELSGRPLFYHENNNGVI